MYTITGVTGHVGGVVAQELLRRGVAVRVVVRTTASAETWRQRGAEVAIADFNDRAALTEALVGSDGAFVMLPTVATAGDAEHRRMADSIGAAVRDSGTAHVVMLSSLGAELAEGTGPIRWLHHLENRLRESDAVVSAIRSAHFQEKVEDVLAAARDASIYPVFGDTADVAFPMIATTDIGRLAAEKLLAPPAASEIIDLDGPAYSERQVAARLADLLGKHLDVVIIPRADWYDVMVDDGVPAPLAHELVELHDAARLDLFRRRGDRRHMCTTPIEETLRHLVHVATSGLRTS